MPVDFYVVSSLETSLWSCFALWFSRRRLCRRFDYKHYSLLVFPAGLLEGTEKLGMSCSQRECRLIFACGRKEKWCDKGESFTLPLYFMLSAPGQRRWVCGWERTQNRPKENTSLLQNGSLITINIHIGCRRGPQRPDYHRSHERASPGAPYGGKKQNNNIK